MVTCANCQGIYQATSIKCPISHKAKKKARRAKSSKKKKRVDKTVEQQSESERLNEEPKEVNPNLDIENNDWVGSPSASLLSSVEDLKFPDNKGRW